MSKGDYICHFEVWNGLSNRIKFEDEYCGGGNWASKRKKQNNVTPEEYKQRWVKYLAA